MIIGLNISSLFIQEIIYSSFVCSILDNLLNTTYMSEIV